LHILVAVVVLACCRILHDSMLTLAPAREVVASRVIDVRFLPSTNPITAPSTEFAAWVDEMLHAPDTIDGPPAALTTRPIDKLQWGMWNFNIPQMVAVDHRCFDSPPPLASTPAIDLLNDASTVRGGITYLDSLTGGSVVSWTSGPGRSTEPQQSFLASPPPAVAVTLDATTLGDPSLRPVLSAPPAAAPVGVGTIPSPIPEPGTVILLILASVSCRSWRRFGRAL